jgi:apurinic endonuclease APN1
MVKIGFPVPKNPDKGKLSEYLLNIHKTGFKAFQVCVSAPNNGYYGKPFSKTEAAAIRKICKENDIYGVVHGKYIYNFCRKLCDYQVDQLVNELELANDINCDVIIHQGNNMPEENLTRLEALNNYAKRVGEALDRTFDLNNGIILENSARQGNELGYQLKELAYIYNQFSEDHKKRLGFCLDLCHVFVAGELDVRSATAVENYFVEFDTLIGLDKLKCIHFNDSAIPFDGCNDHHGDINCGYISNPLLGGSPDGFKVISSVAHSRGIPIIFETPCGFSQFHNGGSQIVWQKNVVEGWALGSDKAFTLYTAMNPQLPELAKYYYENEKEIKKAQRKKRAAAKKKKKDPPKASTIQTSSNQPKIQIKLKTPNVVTEPKIQIKLKEN